MKSVTPPIFMNSLHVFDTVDEYFSVDIFQDEYYYGRASNPTVAILEKKLAALEHGVRAVAFSAGMAACTAAIMAVCKMGSHIICLKESYGPVQHLLDDYLTEKMNVSVTYVNGTKLEDFEEAIRPETDLIILESPSTLLFSVIDLEGSQNWRRSTGSRRILTIHIPRRYSRNRWIWESTLSCIP